MSTRSRIANASLAISRILLAAWVGSAVLFVINGVRLVTMPEFDSVVRNQIAAVRFPAYYVFGTVCLLTALACSLFSLLNARPASVRLKVAVVLILVSGGIVAFDYWTIYLPLEEMIIPPDQPRPAEFTSLHERSKWINMVHVSIAFFACWILPTCLESESDLRERS